MIGFERGPEPALLLDVRTAKLVGLRRIAATRPPVAGDIEGYRVIAEHIWRAQHHKCCYCETILLLGYNDVDHFRPKAWADRGPHCAATHGYWWLSFTWENLLFSCAGCNRGLAKGTRFPLAAGSVALDPLTEEEPPGRETPLLIDPATESGIDHIEFRFSDREKMWRPVPRGGSPKGDATIAVCRLDREDLLELYTSHVERNVLPEVHEVRNALARGDKRALHEAHWRAQRRLLRPSEPYVGLSYDALVHHISDDDLAPFRLSWFRPTGRL